MHRGPTFEQELFSSRGGVGQGHSFARAQAPVRQRAAHDLVDLARKRFEYRAGQLARFEGSKTHRVWPYGLDDFRGL